MRYPRRLIEVDLPIKEVSAHARREKSIRHGHISTLHIWWARRPLAACRAVICAALWPDPADPECPQGFRDAAARVLRTFAGYVRTERRVGDLCLSHQKEWMAVAGRGFEAGTVEGQTELREFLLRFIADFANWDAASQPEFLRVATELSRAGHEALGGEPDTRPLLFDPFAGGGSIPLEGLRVGTEVFASDLNPIPVLLNQSMLQFMPQHGERLALSVDMWGKWVKERALDKLGAFYPSDPDGATPIAYIWARTIRCEGPGCAAEVPLVRSLWLAKKGHRSVALRVIANNTEKVISFEIVEGCADIGPGTVARGSATCPICGYTTPVARVRSQLSSRRSGVDDARLIAVVLAPKGSGAAIYRTPSQGQVEAARAAAKRLQEIEGIPSVRLPIVPDEPFPFEDSRAFTPGVYGVRTWGDLFTPRQKLLLSSLAELIREVGVQLDRTEWQLSAATVTMLSMALAKMADYESSLCIWRTARTCVAHTFGRQALPITWDFGEMNPFAGSAGDWGEACDYLLALIRTTAASIPRPGQVRRASATAHPLPDDSAEAFITDPPYYDAVPYADLSDYFYVWHRRALAEWQPESFSTALTPKDDEAVVNPAARMPDGTRKDYAFYQSKMSSALGEARRVLMPNGIGVIVFAHKSTAGWEAILESMLAAGWTVTASWPIDTERPGRLRSHDSAALASSIHLVCRPRKNPDGSLRTDDLGDWRDVLTELPTRIHDWMPRLAREGVVGADAIFACLGPALEIFSRYSRVEKASGEAVTLREYLEHVWAAVAREALSMIFEGAEATGFEEDARLTAMWLWTLSTGARDETGTDDDEDADEDDADAGRKKPTGGFALEFDAARKIAQGLGAHLESLEHVLEVKGDTARLRGVAERTRYLFGKDQADAPTVRKARKPATMELFGEFDPEQTEGTWGEKAAPKPGATTLDRVHQAMILFAAGRTEALRRFVVEEGAGNDPLFWRLAQALSALYPTGADEKRWVDGLLARKRSLGS